MPITRGSTPATAEPRKRPSGSIPSSRAFSSEAITSAAAPSLRPDALPAVTVPPARKAGLQGRELLRRRVGARMLVLRHVADGDELVVEPARLGGLGPAPLRAERERVLILACHGPALGDVLARLAHRLEREPLLQPRVREPPAERRVVQRAIAPRKRGVRLAPSRAAHATSTRRRPRRRGRRRRRSPRGRRRRRRRDPTRRAGSRSRRRSTRAGRRAGPPCARRCGCPRPPGSRSRARRPRSAPPAHPRGRRRRGSRAPRDRPAASPARPPPYRPTGVRTADRITALVIRRRTLARGRAAPSPRAGLVRPCRASDR